MALIGYTLSFWVKLRPILQYYGFVGEQSAALVGFSMTYSTETVGIIQQFVTNYSDLEMQLIAIERLSAYNADAERRYALEGEATLERGGSGLQLRNVTVTYRAGLLPALVGVSLAFSPGEIAAIVGRTGAGKSSLLLSILQLVPHEGSIVVNGEVLQKLASEDVRRRLVGVVPQQPVLFDGDLRWNLDPESCRKDQELWAALAAVGLEGKCRGAGGFTAKIRGNSDETSDEGLDKVEFSAGQQQMLCAARVLLRQPKVAMLDEVAASLPSEAAHSMVSTLVGRFKAHNTTTLIVTHQENLLSCCDRVVRFAGGRVVGDNRL
jgi:ABC-type multidrug transport system fused ATPase/permease subunit